MGIYTAHPEHCHCFPLAKTGASHPQQRGTQDKLQNPPKKQNKRCGSYLTWSLLSNNSLIVKLLTAISGYPCKQQLLQCQHTLRYIHKVSGDFIIWLLASAAASSLLLLPLPVKLRQANMLQSHLHFAG